jgi:predicted ATP-grasp superfamily ATP-dependent carboligase
MTSRNVPALVELGRRFFEGLNYTGVGSIEFKKDDKDGTFKLIELNPRLWQQNIQATYAGVNFAYINYLDCIGEMVEPSLHFRENVRYVDRIQDFRSFLGNRQRGDVSIYQWLTSVYKADCFAYFAWDDMIPAWKRLICLIRDTPEKLHERTWEDTGIVYKTGEASSHF